MFGDLLLSQELPVSEEDTVAIVLRNCSAQFALELCTPEIHRQSWYHLQVDMCRIIPLKSKTWCSMQQWRSTEGQLHAGTHSVNSKAGLEANDLACLW